jgi:hypothetical protein
MINVLELKTIELALKSYSGGIRDLHIRSMSYNTIAIVGISKQSSTRSLECKEVAHTIWLWALSRRVWLSAAHVPGLKNVEVILAQFRDKLE